MNDSLVARVAALKTADFTDLKQMWQDMFQQEPPPFNRRFIESRLAYRIQELALGGLKRETIKRLERLGEQLDGGKQSLRSRRTDGRPVTGTRLIRKWTSSNTPASGTSRCPALRAPSPAPTATAGPSLAFRRAGAWDERAAQTLLCDLHA